MSSPAPSTTVSATTTATTTATTATTATANTVKPDIVPTATALVQAARLGIQQDKPIQLDYYVDSAQSKAFLGEDAETKERVLIKSKEEFTSLVQKVYKVDEDILILTENSIYLVNGKIQKRKINLAALHSDE
jgi:hypothetical protein